jgi:hypothetical protein
VTGSGRLLLMHLTTVLAQRLAQGAEETSELPAEPWVFGVVTFGLLTAMLIALLMFGKGRPHS